MLRSILPHPTYDHLFSNEPDGGDGGDGGAGGGGTPPAGGEPSGSGEKTVAQSKVDEIVKGRVEQTKRTTEEAIAKQLGVPIEEAKRLIADAKKREDSEKSEAQLAREAADAEKAEAEKTKAESALARHEAAVERALIRALPNDLDDDVLDKKVGRLGRLLDLEVGADADAIKAAVSALKKEEPEMFGAAGEKGTPPPHGDPKGTPPKRTGTEGAYERGQKRAKERAASTGYPILAGALPDTPST